MTDTLLPRMYQYSRAVYRSIMDLVDPYVDPETRMEYKREVLAACEDTVERLAKDPRYFSRPDRALFQDIRRYFPLAYQAQVNWAITQGIGAAVGYIEAPDRVGRVRRRYRPLPRHDPQGEAVPAHAAPRPRVLPLAPASRDPQGRGLTAVTGLSRLQIRRSP